jgi:hypothetical protein
VAGAADHAAWNDKPLASGGVRHKRDADCFGAAAVLPVSGAPSCRYVGPYLDGCGQGASVETSLLLLAYAAGAVTSLAAALLVGGRVFAAMKRSLGVGEWVRRGLGVAPNAGRFAPSDSTKLAVTRVTISRQSRGRAGGFIE